MKINSTGAFGAMACNLDASSISLKNNEPEKSGVEKSPQFRRSEFRRPDRPSQELQELQKSQVPHGMQDGVRPRNQRHHPYLRPVPFIHASQPGHETELVHRNEFAACKLFDQMRAMLPHHPTAPGNPSSLDFDLNGQSYRVKAFSGRFLMFDYVNPNQTLYSLKIEQGNSVRGIEGFPDGQERLAGLLTLASARLQEVTS